MGAEAAGETDHGVGFLQKSQLASEEILEVDDLAVTGDNTVGRLFEGQTNVGSKSTVASGTRPATMISIATNPSAAANDSSVRIRMSRPIVGITTDKNGVRVSCKGSVL